MEGEEFEKYVADVENTVKALRESNEGLANMNRNLAEQNQQLADRVAALEKKAPSESQLARLAALASS